MGLHCWHYFLNIDHIVNDLTLPLVCAFLYFLDCDLRWHSSCWQAENSQLSAGVVTGAWEFTFGVRLRCFPEKTCQIGLESWLTNNHSLSCYLVFQLETDLKLQFLYLIVAFWLTRAGLLMRILSLPVESKRLIFRITFSDRRLLFHRNVWK